MIGCLRYILDHKIDMNLRIKKILPLFSESNRLNDLSIRSLVSHTSGLKPWKNFWINNLTNPKRDVAIFKNHLARYSDESLFNKDESYCYSDLNYIILGFLIEQLSSKNLENCISRDGLFFAGKNSVALERYVSYGFCPVRKKEIRGFVHDENCYSFDGISSHAGLFSDSSSVKSNLLDFINCHEDYLLEAQKNLNIRKGLQIQDSSPLIFKRPSVGHLGFVGNDIWIDPIGKNYFILLTNRVKKERISPFMKVFRKEIYSIIEEEI